MGWITIRQAKIKYRLDRKTIIRAICNGRLPVLSRHGRGGRLWRLINEDSLRDYLSRRRLGVYSRSQKLLSWTGPALPQALLISEVAELEGVDENTVQVAILRGALRAEKNERNAWIIRPEDVRAWRESKAQIRRGRPRTGFPDPIWVDPPTPEEIELVRELVYVGLLALQMAEERGIPLEPMWSGRLVHAIHEREKPAHRAINGVV